MSASAKTIRMRIDSIVPGGDGIGRHEGMAIFVPMAAPGDELLVRIVDERSGFLRGQIESILEPGPSRVEPACPYYGVCGGCNLMHLSYEAQLEAKLGIAREAWRRSGGIDDVEFSIAASSPLGYRNRAQFHLTKGGLPAYSRRSSRGSSSELLGIGSCPILTSVLDDWLKDTSQDKSTCLGTIARSGRDRFVVFGYGNKAYLEGRDRILSVDLGGKSLRFDVGGFFQSNLEMVELLVPQVCAGVSGERAADLYCGVGLFGTFLKDSFAHLQCVEQDQRAVAHACSNVGPKADYAALSIEAWSRSAGAREHFDYVVVDPPRAGLAPAVRAWLARSRPPVLGYVSCDPVSMARDAGFLVQAGYTIEHVSLFDFYPQTSHLESHARFRLG